jgi:hypothetical protein
MTVLKWAVPFSIIVALLVEQPFSNLKFAGSNPAAVHTGRTSPTKRCVLTSMDGLAREY